MVLCISKVPSCCVCIVCICFGTINNNKDIRMSCLPDCRAVGPLSVCRCSNIEVVLQYAKWALDRDEEVAMCVFTERVEGEKSEQLEPPFLLDFLKPYPMATLVYLECLVNDKNSMVRTCIYKHDNCPPIHLECPHTCI